MNLGWRRVPACLPSLSGTNRSKMGNKFPRWQVWESLHTIEGLIVENLIAQLGAIRFTRRLIAAPWLHLMALLF